MRKTIISILIFSLLICLLAGCGGPEPASVPASTAAPAAASAAPKTPAADAPSAAPLPDGVYSAEFETDSSMFRPNEACDGKGTLTVQDGKMTIHVSLLSKKILNLFPGTAEQAQQEGAVWLEPTLDTVTYSDGLSEEVYGFDIPVPAIGEDFDLALVGTKGAWYDHKVSVQNPEPMEEEGTDVPADGAYTCAVTLEGGSGRATVESPAALRVEQGQIFAPLVWRSPNSDSTLVYGQRYEPVNTEGNAVFEIPVSGFDRPLPVVADTVAMSTPHEISYTLTFDSTSLRAQDA